MRAESRVSQLIMLLLKKKRSGAKFREITSFLRKQCKQNIPTNCVKKVLRNGLALGLLGYKTNKTGKYYNMMVKNGTPLKKVRRSDKYGKETRGKAKATKRSREKSLRLRSDHRVTSHKRLQRASESRRRSRSPPPQADDKLSILYTKK